MMGLFAAIANSKLLALTDQQPSMDGTAAIGGAADMNVLRPAGRTGENDPNRTEAGRFCCGARS
jgi:hypothetical protein